jgi:hypothetical protein
MGCPGTQAQTPHKSLTTMKKAGIKYISISHEAMVHKYI